jgi:serine/threonine protein phosphatase PrpC
VKTRQGYIPGQKKTNQDNFIAINNFSGIKDHWMMGVCDGHGVQGHLVSNFIKVNLPKILSNLMLGHDEKKKSSFLPSIKSKNPYEIEGVEKDEDDTHKGPVPENLEYWLSNNNFRQRDSQIKDAFILTEQKME